MIRYIFITICIDYISCPKTKSRTNISLVKPNPHGKYKGCPVLLVFVSKKRLIAVIGDAEKQIYPLLLINCFSSKIFCNVLHGEWSRPFMK